MRQSLRIALRVLLLGGVGLTASQVKAQLKVGSNPTNVQKNAILELESKKQGLLLPRLDDFSGINGMGIPVKDGMLVYKLAAADGAEGLYIRQAGAWVLLASAADATSNWKLTGNNGKTGDFIGTRDAFPLVFKTDNKERFKISSDGKLQAGTDANIPTEATSLKVLVLAADGTVSQRTLNANAFGKVVSTLDGLDGDVTFTLTGDGNIDNITKAAAAGDVKVSVPVMNKNTQQYGFLSLADWNKIQASQKQIVIGNFAIASNPNGLSIDQTGAQASLILHPADAANPGGVSITAQEFKGIKTFLDQINGSNGLNITAGGATIKGATTLENGVTINAGATVNGDAQFNNKLLIPSAAAVTAGNKVLLQGAGGEVVTRQLNDAAFDGSITTLNTLTGPKIDLKAGSAGTDFNIVPDASKTPMELNLNIPNASVTNLRGLVTNDAQSFGGVKKFADSLYAAKSVLVGNTVYAANSTLQVGYKGAGTVSMPIRTVTTDDAPIGDAYTVLVKSTSPIQLHLPKAADVEGRVITIKKIPATATDDNTDNPVTIKTLSGDTIEGGTAFNIINDWTFVTLQSDGVNGWYIIKK
ncbi:hypothetical protein SAMN05660909_03551 [Chitinophaga terrae (ex Kim and Jung 2007)]|uniref:Uncharacterized protein n=1 Tax=Chitinophaga terrae (ex Kim and Jung 2007) TaxID=408074 RepID=A0A1H4E7A3_9BACT|nr:hypothetical protein [Chitinophaga terrae (ex Kim and Jung 2007)]SEA80679.1 hypothetical protein SAMN05660909_03551 [Chitinophaga terrae (ex Kim and Jung 2007)]